jgi:predicted nuclease of predicted toxin-antitoxin system
VRFLADESCDFAVVTALRNAGHEVTAIADTNPGSEDDRVLELARSEQRVLLTEDKDFGQLAYAGGQHTAGVILVRFPAAARRSLGESIVDVVEKLGERMASAFVVLEPGRARLSKPPSSEDTSP